jgi:hypothetical protein
MDGIRGQYMGHSTLNWLSGGESAGFCRTRQCHLDDTSANKTVTAGGFAVGRIVFSNDADYVLNGGGTSQIRRNARAAGSPPL